MSYAAILPAPAYFQLIRLFRKKHTPTANRLVYIPSGWLSTILALMPKSKTDLPRLAQYFIDHADQVFTFSDLEFLLVENSDQRNLPPSRTPKVFLRMLLKKTKLRELRLHSPHYSSLLRYTAQNNVSPISLALSIMKKDAYFSHASAMWIHGLGKDDRNVSVRQHMTFLQVIENNSIFTPCPIFNVAVNML
jgi:hypothetical protein